MAEAPQLGIVGEDCLVVYAKVVYGLCYLEGGVVAILIAEGERESAILRADAEKQAAILKAEAEQQAAILKADGEAQAILAVQKALADSLEMLNEKAPNDQVIKLKSIQAMEKVADGKATKIIIPSQMQGLVGLANGLVEGTKEQ